MTTPVAILPMDDWPEVRPAVDRARPPFRPWRRVGAR